MLPQVSGLPGFTQFIFFFCLFFCCAAMLLRSLYIFIIYIIIYILPALTPLLLSPLLFFIFVLFYISVGLRLFRSVFSWRRFSLSLVDILGTYAPTVHTYICFWVDSYGVFCYSSYGAFLLIFIFICFYVQGICSIACWDRYACTYGA